MVAARPAPTNMPKQNPPNLPSPAAAAKPSRPALADWRPTLDPDKLRRRRKLLGLNQTEMAAKLGTSQGAYGDIERGDRSGGLTLWRAAQICLVLGAGIEELMGDPPPWATRVRTLARRKAERAGE